MNNPEEEKESNSASWAGVAMLAILCATIVAVFYIVYVTGGAC